MLVIQKVDMVSCWVRIAEKKRLEPFFIMKQRTANFTKYFPNRLTLASSIHYQVTFSSQQRWVRFIHNADHELRLPVPPAGHGLASVVFHPQVPRDSHRAWTQPCCLFDFPFQAFLFYSWSGICEVWLFNFVIIIIIWGFCLGILFAFILLFYSMRILNFNF